MASKSSPSLIRRFSGAAGRKRFIEVLQEQEIVAGNKQLARRLAAAATRHELPAGHEFLTQGNSDNEIYFILSGSVSVKVNGREVATRGAGEHLGEMALLDTTAKRSATSRTIEPTVVAKVTESQFTKIAQSYPDLWRRTAVALARRLRERNKFQTPSRSQPVIFIGSSSEGIKIAETIHRSMRRQDWVLKLWTQGVFECSQTTIEDLMRTTRQADFAVLVLTADDLTRSRGASKPSPRDNVTFELGLFMGALGRDRTYIVVPRRVNLKLPTDLLGVTCLMFEQRRGRTLARNLQSVTREIRKLILKHGPI